MYTRIRLPRGSLRNPGYHRSGARDTLEFVCTLPAARPLLIAHRAGNDLARGSEAISAGADLVEADVWLYRGRLELRHDKTIRGLPLLWDRWHLNLAFGRRLLLNDLLDAIDPAAGVMLDLKGNAPELAAAVDAALRCHPRAGATGLCSQNWRHVDAFAGRGDVAAVHSIGRARRLRRVLASRRRFEAISINSRLLTAETAVALRERAGLIMAWHVPDMASADRLIDLGAGALIIDDLDLIARIRARRAAPAP